MAVGITNPVHIICNMNEWVEAMIVNTPLPSGAITKCLVYDTYNL